jgi:hypothetical protein
MVAMRKVVHRELRATIRPYSAWEYPAISSKFKWRDTRNHGAVILTLQFLPPAQDAARLAAPEVGVTDELLSMEYLCAIMDAANPAKKREP